MRQRISVRTLLRVLAAAAVGAVAGHAEAGRATGYGETAQVSRAAGDIRLVQQRETVRKRDTVQKGGTVNIRDAVRKGETVRQRETVRKGGTVTKGDTVQKGEGGASAEAGASDEISAEAETGTRQVQSTGGGTYTTTIPDIATVVVDDAAGVVTITTENGNEFIVPSNAYDEATGTFEMPGPAGVYVTGVYVGDLDGDGTNEHYRGWDFDSDGQPDAYMRVGAEYAATQDQQPLPDFGTPGQRGGDSGVTVSIGTPGQPWGDSGDVVRDAAAGGASACRGSSAGRAAARLSPRGRRPAVRPRSTRSASRCA